MTSDTPSLNDLRNGSKGQPKGPFAGPGVTYAQARRRRRQPGSVYDKLEMYSMKRLEIIAQQPLPTDERLRAYIKGYGRPMP
jgi:hypothetical protein